MCGPNTNVRFFGADGDELVVIGELDTCNAGMKLAWK